MTTLHDHRKQANDVIRGTVSRIRELRREVSEIKAAGGNSAKSELTLNELEETLVAMLTLRRSAGM